MHRRLFLLLVLCWSTGPASAQFWDFVYRVLNGDTSAGLDHDTAYIVSYRDDLTLSPVSSYQGNTIDLRRKDGGSLSYQTNTPAQYGLALDYKWLGVEATFTIPGLSTLEEGRGPTEAVGLGFGYTGRRWWFRNFFRNTEGFYAADPRRIDPEWIEGDPYPQRDDIANFTYMAVLNYGFNARRFSYNAAIWQIEQQKRSAGSWTAGATFWYSQTQWKGSLIPDFDRASYEETTVDLSAGRSWIFSITGGYAHTVSLWEHGFINAMVVPGIGFQQLRLELAEQGTAESGWELTGTAEFRAGAGYVDDRWYVAFTASSFRNVSSVEPDVRFGSTFLNARLAAGWRFKNIKPIWPAVGM